ncbi:MAG: MmcQ/YjbR family DNA-binding protein [Clostridia bacterium]|nr:MmcQ/YjbR family DNA-binding protein [Clostridia bacterium]
MDILAYLKGRKGAYEDYPFGPEPLVMKVCSRMFALVSSHQGVISLSLKCDPLIAQALRQQYPSVTPGYHLNKQHWNTVRLDGTVPDAQILWMIDHSYEMVTKGLSRKEKQQLLFKTP